ncbi:MAG: LysM peptidoglycan-binding domain-containing protein, partial [Desulfobacterales bacterium]|nr:LysM peptidoglycan-binding domain-containing protein [Desulfobacterales bacterium]
MAQAITVAPGDTIGKILTRRGIKAHETHTWLGKVRSANPHIGDPNRIWPGDKILLPDSLIEVVPEYQVWQNALSGVPQALKRPHNGNT